jgi:hypothetical protein
MVNISFWFKLMTLTYLAEVYNKENAKTLLAASKEAGLEVNAEKRKHKVTSRDQNAIQNLNIKFDNKSFESARQFKYLGRTLKYQHFIEGEFKSRMKSGNACYLSVQNIWSSSLLSENIKITIYRTTILPVVLYGCETWLLTLMEECRLRVSENRVLTKMLGTKRNDVTGDWRRLHNAKLNDLYLSTNTIRVIKKNVMGGIRSTYGERRGANRVWWGDPK